MNKTAFVFVVLMFAIGIPPYPSSSWSNERPAIQASDVVFMYPANPASKYDEFYATVAGWGGRPSGFEGNSIERFKKRVEEAHQRGIRYCASVDFLVDFAGMIDFRPETFEQAICRDLENQPITVPWLWDHTHKGHPAYWFCFNNPDVQAYYKDQVKRACSAPIDGLHIDDYAGTSHCSEFRGGCFCTYCRDGFRAYLKSNYSDSHLNELGVDTIDTFDYQSFLKAKHISADEFRRKRAQLPLGKIFQDFQNECMKARIRDVFEYAESLRGQPLLRSINSHASTLRTLIPAPIIDYFCGEVGHDASKASISNEPIFVYRMVEAVGDRQTATASGQDWAWIKANDKPGLARGWIAQAYAFGSVFMVPHHQWCYTQELGTHWWEGKPADFADLFKFVRDHAEWFDNARNAADTAIIFTNKDFSSAKRVAGILADKNIPFAIVYPSEDQESFERSPDTLHPYRTLVASQSDRSTLLKGLPDTIQTIDFNTNFDSISSPIQIVGSDRIRVSWRRTEHGGRIHFICHVLNQSYDATQDRVIPADIVLRIDTSLLDGHTIQSAVRYQPGRTEQVLEFKQEKDLLSVSLPQSGVWAIVKLETQ